jgi:hypothetical protein
MVWIQSANATAIVVINRGQRTFYILFVGLLLSLFSCNAPVSTGVDVLTGDVNQDADQANSQDQTVDNTQVIDIINNISINLNQVGELIGVRPGDEITISAVQIGLVSFSETSVEIFIDGVPVDIISSTDAVLSFVFDIDGSAGVTSTSIVEVVDQFTKQPVARYALTTLAIGTPFPRMVDLSDIAPLAGPILTTPGAVMEFETEIVSMFDLNTSKFDIFVGGVLAPIVEQSARRVRFEVPATVSGVVTAEVVSLSNGEVSFVFLLEVR